LNSLYQYLILFCFVLFCFFVCMCFKKFVLVYECHCSRIIFPYLVFHQLEPFDSLLPSFAWIEPSIFYAHSLARCFHLPRRDLIQLVKKKAFNHFNSGPRQPDIRYNLIESDNHSANNQADNSLKWSQLEVLDSGVIYQN
jgi:hypothetical protein